MNRRNFLTATAAFAGLAASPDILHAAVAEGGDWTLMVRDVEADLPRQALRKLHGKAPADLAGTLFRNGPAKFHRPGGSVGHWFDGDGLVRSFQIRDGQASLAARFVDTAKRRADTKADAMITPGFGTSAGKGAAVGSSDDISPANTSVMMAGKELWALWEAGSPVAMNPETLDTIAPKVLRPDLARMPFLAHPRVEPNGRVWNLGQSGRRALVWRLAPGGALEAADMIDLGRASYIHDFTATDRHLVIVLQPWIQERFVAPVVRSYDWKPELGTRILVIDKDDLSKRREFEAPPLFFFHLGDAWSDKDGTIRFDAAIDQDPSFALNGAMALMQGKAVGSSDGKMVLISLRPDGRVDVDRPDLVGEFPRVDPRFAGQSRTRTAHLTKGSPNHPVLRAVAVTDWKRGRTDSFDFGPNQITEEVVFVPRKGGTEEFDGWLVGSTINITAKHTELHVFDARRVAEGPVVSWAADRALPMTFHGVFAEA